jgi:hypothetical protein
VASVVPECAWSARRTFWIMSHQVQPSPAASNSAADTLRSPAALGTSQRRTTVTPWKSAFSGYFHRPATDPRQGRTRNVAVTDHPLTTPALLPVAPEPQPPRHGPPTPANGLMPTLHAAGARQLPRESAQLRSDGPLVTPDRPAMYPGGTCRGPPTDPAPPPRRPAQRPRRRIRFCR